MNLINHRSKFFINGYKKYIYLKNSIDNNLFGLITPHAGLSYCGELLEYAYSEVNWDKFNKVILLSTHHKPWNSIPKSKTFSLSEDLILNIDDFVGLDEFVEKSDDDCLNEHSWLVQMPFLLGKNLKICVILLGKYDIEIVNKIKENLDKDTLLLANTDLLHCGPDFNIDCPDDIDEYNNKTIERIKSMDIENDKISMCGYSAIKTFLEVLKKKNSVYEIKHDYFTSRKKDKDSKNSVGYASMLFYKKTKYPIYYSGGLLNKKEELDILNIPRKTIELMFEIYTNGISRDRYKIIKINHCYNNFLKKYTWKKYKEKYGIFVTINNSNDQLRGCLGNFTPQEAGESIVMQTLNSAVLDPRFDPINKYEYQSLKYKINFLNEQFTIYNNESHINPLESLSDMEFGKSKGHGITIIFNNGSESTYLSSVLPEYFNINNYDDLKLNWNKLVLSMYNKANYQNYRNIDLKEINEIKLYYCIEFDEKDELTI